MQLASQHHRTVAMFDKTENLSCLLVRWGDYYAPWLVSFLACSGASEATLALAASTQCETVCCVTTIPVGRRPEPPDRLKAKPQFGIPWASHVFARTEPGPGTWDLGATTHAALGSALSSNPISSPSSTLQGIRGFFSWPAGS